MFFDNSPVFVVDSDHKSCIRHRHCSTFLVHFEKRVELSNDYYYF